MRRHGRQQAPVYQRTQRTVRIVGCDTGTTRRGVDADSMARAPCRFERNGASLDPPAAVTVSVARAPTIAGFA